MRTVLACGLHRICAEVVSLCDLKGLEKDECNIKAGLVQICVQDLGRHILQSIYWKLQLDLHSGAVTDSPTQKREQRLPKSTSTTYPTTKYAQLQSGIPAP